MANIGYSFDYGKKSPKSGGGLRRLIIFITLLIVALIIFYIARPGKDKPLPKPDGKTTPRTIVKPTLKPVAKPLPKPLAKPTPKPVVKPTPRPIVSPPKKLVDLYQSAITAFNKAEYVKARNLCAKILSAKQAVEGSALRTKTLDILGKANIKILMTDIPCPDKKIIYTVKKGDFLRKIALNHHTTIDAIQAGNNRKPDNHSIWLGHTLKIYQGDWRVAVSKSGKWLHLYDGKDIFKAYPIGIGKQNRTPTGSFIITSKIKEPPWYSPSGKIIPYGDKENVLGTRWLKLKPTGKTNTSLRGYGIHGTWEPDSIGKSMSNGCIRMKNSDIEELFSIIPRQTPVTITE